MAPRSVATGCCAASNAVTPGKNQKFYVAGALDVRTGGLHTTGAASKNAALSVILAGRYRRARRVHLVVDNYGVDRHVTFHQPA